MISETMLFTAFKDSSSEKLIDVMYGYPTVILPNDKIRDSEIVRNMISNGATKYVVCFGQKPVLKDKVTIELSAKGMGGTIDTSFPWQELKNQFEKHGVSVKISNNAGTSFCNALYYKSMEYIKQTNLNTEVIFIHIPMIKNITEKGKFFQKINNTVLDFAKGLREGM